MKRKILCMTLAAGMLLTSPTSALAAGAEGSQATESFDNVESEEQTADIDVLASEYVYYGESGDFSYKVLENGEAEINRYSGEASEVTFPQTVDGYPVRGISSYISLPEFVTKVVIPEGVTRIADSAFYSSKLEEVILPGSLETLGESAFSRSNLTKIILPEGLEEIEKGTFNDCKNLEEVTLPKKLKRIGKNAFYECDSLKEIVIPGSVASIEDYAFEGCSNLKKISVSSDSAASEVGTGIGNDVFRGCESLTEAEIPAGIKTIGDYAFGSCVSLKKISLPKGLTGIGRYAFYKCGSLTEITLPGGMTTIGNSAFYECKGLKTVNVSSDTAPTETGDGLGKYAFEGCKNLTKVSLPSGIAALGEWAFSGCSKLKTVDFPAALTSIGDDAFYNCDALTEVWLPQGLQKLFDYVFASCDNLVTVMVPASVTYIGNSVFGSVYSSKVTVYVRPNSYALEYAQSRGYRYAILQEAAVGSFQDVKKSDWFCSAVSYVHNNGLMTGLNTLAFGPNESLARAQFAIILYRMNNSPKVSFSNKFRDVGKNDWYADAILWASSTKVVTGYSNGNFGPSDNINREQMALMMYRYAQYKGYNVSQKADFGKFTDASRVSSYAKAAMQWAFGNKIITGKDNGTRLDPQGYASRAECATIIMRFLEKYK